MTWITASPWAYPALESLHIFGIALLVGSLVVFELRVWGAGASLDAAALSRLALKVTVAGFALAAGSGVVMFAAQAAELLANRAFTLKMLVLILAGCNAILFHSRGSVEKRDRVARAQTVLSTGLWLLVIICGRWIAYV